MRIGRVSSQEIGWSAEGMMEGVGELKWAVLLGSMLAAGGQNESRSSEERRDRRHILPFGQVIEIWWIVDRSLAVLGDLCGTLQIGHVGI